VVATFEFHIRINPIIPEEQKGETLMAYRKGKRVSMLFLNCENPGACLSVHHSARDASAVGKPGQSLSRFRGIKGIHQFYETSRNNKPTC